MPVETTYMTLAGRPCVVPQDSSRNLGYLCPLGATPGYGACLMTWGELSQVNIHSYVTLAMGSGVNGVSLPNLVVVKAQKITRSAQGHSGGLFLVELSDARYLAAKFNDTNRHFNVWNPRQRAAAIDNIACYYAETLDGSSLWTWSRVAQQLWTDCGLLGSFAFPSVTLNDYPKNLHFVGVNAWSALHQVLSLVGLTTAYDPVSATFSILALGAPQPGLNSLVAAAAPRYYGAADPLESNLAKYPAAIRVYFPRRDRHYGTERDSPSNANWITEPVRVTQVNTGVSGALAGTRLTLWDNQPAIYDYNGFVENSTDLNTITNRRKTDWLNDQSYSESRARTVYSGIISGFRCGSQVKAVHWKYLGMADDHGGYLTEISRHPGLPVALLTDGDWSERYEPFAPEFSRHVTPGYPDSMQLVELTLQQSNYATWSGVVKRLNPEITIGVGPVYSSLESCFIQFVNEDAYRVVPTASPESTINHTRVYKPQAGDRYLARANGVTTSIESVTLPLYTARLDNPQLIWWAELYEDVDAGSYASPSGPFAAKLFIPQAGGAAWLDTGLTLTQIYNTQGAFATGSRVALAFDPEANLFHVLGAVGTGATIRVAKLAESLYPCVDPASPEGPAVATLYECTVVDDAPSFTPVMDGGEAVTIELWNVLQNYYAKDTFVRYDGSDCVYMVTEGFHPGAHIGVLGSALGVSGTSTATLQVGEPDIDVYDPFLHPIDAGQGAAWVYEPTEDSWFAVQVEMTPGEMVCDIVCSNGSLAVSYRDVRFDYTIEACPAAESLLVASTSADDGTGVLFDLLSVQIPPELLTDYVDVSVLAAVYTNPAVPGVMGGGGYSFGTSNPVGP